MTVTPIRTFTIGGSECAAAAGIHPHLSRVMLWCEKTGRVERVETEAMRWGTALEPLVIAELEALGYNVAAGDALVASEREWVTGHPDGLVEDPAEPGFWNLLEVKTIGQWAHRNGDAAPVQYQAQCQWYMHLTGLDRALLAILVGGQRLELVTIDRDDRAIGLLLAGAEDFLGYLHRDTPPPPDAAAKDALLALYPEARAGATVRLTRAEMLLVRDLRERKAQRDEIDRQVEHLENLLKARMGDAEVALGLDDAEVIRWRNASSRRVDVTALKTQRPELAEMFTTETTTRRFTLAQGRLGR